MIHPMTFILLNQYFAIGLIHVPKSLTQIIAKPQFGQGMTITNFMCDVRLRRQS